MPQPRSTYSHTQVGWWLIITLGIVALAVLAIFSGAAGDGGLPPTSARIIGGAVFVTLVVTAVLLTSLTVHVTSDMVIWRFGPGIVRFSLPLAEITSVAPARTPVWAGIGIHWILSGWVYNVSGRGSVVLSKRDGSKVWIGTDEPDALAAAIEAARAGSGAAGAPRGSASR